MQGMVCDRSFEHLVMRDCIANTVYTLGNRATQKQRLALPTMNSHRHHKITDIHAIIPETIENEFLAGCAAARNLGKFG